MKVKKFGFLGIAAVIIVACAVIVGVDAIKDAGNLTVNDVVGSTVSEAQSALKNSGFTNIVLSSDEERGEAASDWVVTSQNPEADTKLGEDEEILLSCVTKDRYALEKVLDPSFAWTAVEQYGKDDFPYGFDLHIISMVAEEASDENTWYLKAPCTVTNEFGAEVDMTCEAHVSGTDSNPTIVDFIVY